LALGRADSLSPCWRLDRKCATLPVGCRALSVDGSKELVSELHTG